MIESNNHRIVQVPEEASAAPDGDRYAKEDSILARQREEFREERATWELHRQQEIEQLRSEGVLLAEAWQRLEAEERRLLAERELLRRGAINGQDTMPSSNTAISTRQREAAYSPGAKHQSDTNDQEHIAWLQFQQLRREIQRFGSRAT